MWVGDKQKKGDTRISIDSPIGWGVREAKLPKGLPAPDSQSAGKGPSASSDPAAAFLGLNITSQLRPWQPPPRFCIFIRKQDCSLRWRGANIPKQALPCAKAAFLLDHGIHSSKWCASPGPRSGLWTSVPSAEETKDEGWQCTRSFWEPHVSSSLKEE